MWMSQSSCMLFKMAGWSRFQFLPSLVVIRIKSQQDSQKCQYGTTEVGNGKQKTNYKSIEGSIPMGIKVAAATYPRLLNYLIIAHHIHLLYKSFKQKSKLSTELCNTRMQKFHLLHWWQFPFYRYAAHRSWYRHCWWPNPVPLEVQQWHWTPRTAARRSLRPLGRTVLCRFHILRSVSFGMQCQRLRLYLRWRRAV